MAGNDAQTALSKTPRLASFDAPSWPAARQSPYDQANARIEAFNAGPHLEDASRRAASNRDALMGTASTVATPDRMADTTQSPAARQMQTGSQTLAAPTRNAPTGAGASELQDASVAGSGVHMVGVVIVVTDMTDAAMATLSRTVQSIEDVAKTIIAIKDASGMPAGITARDDVDVIEVPDAFATEGRARNAAYRHLKKQAPDIQFVQFLTGDITLDPSWFDHALKFMDRRPEVVLLSGRMDLSSTKAPMLARLKHRSRSDMAGELETAGEAALVRVDAFEAAGGFRGDLVGLDMDDLCIRLRRRGFHIWMLNARMGKRETRVKNLGDWLAQAHADGRYYARAVKLHGNGPEKFRTVEHSRAIVWGLALPLLIVALAGLSAGGAAILSNQLPPAYPALAVLAIGAATYFLKYLLIVARSGIGMLDSWVYGIVLILGHFSEAFGIVSAWMSTGKARAKA